MGEETTGFLFSYCYQSDRLNKTFEADKSCYARLKYAVSCDADITYFLPFENTQGSDTFRYDRKLWAPDRYELDGGGREKVPSDYALNLPHLEECVDLLSGFGGKLRMTDEYV